MLLNRLIFVRLDPDELLIEVVEARVREQKERLYGTLAMVGSWQDAPLLLSETVGGSD